jgi:arylsulfatase A-like enzyme
MEFRHRKILAIACLASWSFVSFSHAAEPVPAIWKQTATLDAPEAVQAAAADEKHVYAIASQAIAKYDRATGKKLAVSQGAATHLNSGFLHAGKLYSAHSNYPHTPERSEIKVLDPATMQLATFHDFGSIGGSLTWCVRKGDHWWCNFARYGKDNAETFLVEFDDQWHELSRWTYPAEVIAQIGAYSLSGGVWSGDDLLTTDHDHARLYRLRLPKAGSVLELVATESAPFAGQGIAVDPKTGGLVGINRAKRQVVFAEAVKAVKAASAKLPNIVIILADDLGRGEYSAFGTKDIRTPHIDRIFREGMALDNFFASCCVCSPTRAALLTGCYPDRVGVPGVIRDVPSNSWGYLAPRAVLLPKRLHAANYHTAIVGKWHLGLESPNTPLDRGFDFFHGFLGDMMDDYWTHRRNGHNFMRRDREVIEPEGHATDLFTDWACEYIAERSQTKQPFFLYLAYNAPHDPIQPPADWLAKVKAREPQISEKRAGLVALIEHLDSGIGHVLDTLDKRGIADETLVIFTSDNGGLLRDEANNGPWRSGKQHMYEGGLRVPFAARWPGKIAAGSHSAVYAASMDLFPTALAVAGLPASSGIDGVGILPALLGESDKLAERDLYFVRREGGAAYGGKTIEALRRGDWKLLQDSPFAPLELYNLRSDALETTDLARKEPKIFNELSAALRKRIQLGGEVPWQAGDDQPSEHSRGGK